MNFVHTQKNNPLTKVKLEKLTRIYSDMCKKYELNNPTNDELDKVLDKEISIKYTQAKTRTIRNTEIIMLLARFKPYLKYKLEIFCIENGFDEAFKTDLFQRINIKTGTYYEESTETLKPNFSNKYFNLSFIDLLDSKRDNQKSLLDGLNALKEYSSPRSYDTSKYKQDFLRNIKNKSSNIYFVKIDKYYIEDNEWKYFECYKIGITNKTVKKRIEWYRADNFRVQIIDSFKDKDHSELFDTEQLLHKSLIDHRSIVPFNINGSTEMYNINDDVKTIWYDLKN